MRFIIQIYKFSNLIPKFKLQRLANPKLIISYDLNYDLFSNLTYRMAHFNTIDGITLKFPKKIFHIAKSFNKPKSNINDDSNLIQY